VRVEIYVVSPLYCKRKFGTEVSPCVFINFYDPLFFILIYLLNAIGLSPGGSSTVHIYTQTIHRTTQNKQYIEQHNPVGIKGSIRTLYRGNIKIQPFYTS
jgi:hypothetical protein